MREKVVPFSTDTKNFIGEMAHGEENVFIDDLVLPSFNSLLQESTNTNCIREIEDDVLSVVSPDENTPLQPELVPDNIANLYTFDDYSPFSYFFETPLAEDSVKHQNRTQPQQQRTSSNGGNCFKHTRLQPLQSLVPISRLNQCFKKAQKAVPQSNKKHKNNIIKSTRRASELVLHFTTEDEELTMSTKDFHRYCREKNMNSERIAFLHQARRRLKNRGYAKDAREKRLRLKDETSLLQR